MAKASGNVTIKGSKILQNWNVLRFSRNYAIIPGLRVSEEPGTWNTTLFQLVMLALVASIHVLNSALHQ